jgi:enamine deaminase RidA (YjgF/YER057c/UK114 family)
VIVAGRVEASHGDRDVRARPRFDLPKCLHCIDTTPVDRQRISSGAAFEERVGYSRAVRVGRHVWVSGTAPILPSDEDPPADPYEQARICIEIIARALGEAGAKLTDVVRTRIYVTNAEDIDAVGRAHSAAFGNTWPATTGIVTGLLDPRWLVEIEAEAVIP